MNSPTSVPQSQLASPLAATQSFGNNPGVRMDAAQTQQLLNKIEQAGLDTDTVKLLTKLVNTGSLSADQAKSLGTLLSQVDQSKSSASVLPSGMTVQQAREMLKSLAEEAMNPYEINQGRHAGCSVMSGLFVLANRDKGAFFTMGVELASKGKTTLANGDSLQINKDSFEIPSDLKESKGRFQNLSMSERVMMAALMDYGNGSAKYDFKTDKTTGMTVNGKEMEGFTGLYQHQYLKVMTGLFGDGYQVESDQQKAKAILSQNNGNDAKGSLVDIKWSRTGMHANHMVVFMGFDSDGRVLIRNPWGTDNAGANEGPSSRKIRSDLGAGMESISADEFFGRLNGVVVKDNTKPPMTAESDPSLKPDTNIPQYQEVPVTDRVNGFDYQKFYEKLQEKVQERPDNRVSGSSAALSTGTVTKESDNRLVDDTQIDSYAEFLRLKRMREFFAKGDTEPKA